MIEVLDLYAKVTKLVDEKLVSLKAQIQEDEDDREMSYFNSVSDRDESLS